VTLVERLLGILDNPLIIKDGVSRMRSWRAPVVLTLYVGLLGLFGYALFVLLTLSLLGQRTGSAQIGGTVFEALAFFQLSLVSLFAPALAAGAISGERERQTFDVLLISRVTAFGIVWGKLVASVAFMLLLILAALPLFAAVFLFGGIDFGQFVVSQLLIVTTAVSIGAVSLFISSVFRRTLPSTVLAYGVAFAGMVGTFVLGQLFSFAIFIRTAAGGTATGTDLHPFLFANPYTAMWIILNQPNGAAMHVGRLLQLLFLLPGRASTAGPSLEPWQAVILLQIVLVAASVFGAVQLVQSRRAAMPSRSSAAPEPADAPQPHHVGGEA
jgi:ABC-2 type transport system permease protein